MSLPGFTGEFALYQTVRHYRPTTSVNNGTGGTSVVPAVLQIVCDPFGTCGVFETRGGGGPMSWGPLFGYAPVWQGGSAGAGGPIGGFDPFGFDPFGGGGTTPAEDCMFGCRQDCHDRCIDTPQPLKCYFTCRSGCLRTCYS